MQNDKKKLKGFFTLKKRGRGQASIGTIIIFIAIIFVVTLAAGVILQTSLDLQSKAFVTASKAKDSVSTTLMVRNIVGEDGTASKLTEIYSDVQTASGGSDISLSDLGVKLDTTNESRTYIYGSNVSTCDASAVSTGTFDVQYILKSPSYSPGYIQSGDIVRICFSSFNIVENQKFLLSLSPKNGQVIRVEVSSPAVFETTGVSLYP